MADVLYNLAKKEILSGELNLTSSTLKLLLVGASYTPNADHTVADAGGANDVIDHEINPASGYVRGHGGAGRKTAAGKTFTANNTLDKGEFVFSQLTWTAVASATIAHVILVKEAGADDTATRLIACWDIADVNPNGNDFAFTPGTIRI
jgi:hypothetical protein